MGVPHQKGMLEEGTTFGRYQIVRHMGSGGMGSVYEGIHTQLGKRVAIKTLLPQYAANPEAQSRFLREGKLAAKLQHPHVVDVTDFGIEDTVPFLVMEYLEGEDLSSLLEHAKKLFPAQIVDVMLPIAAALASAHDQQIIHRDLKPQNIFLARSGSGEVVPKVLDFGISKLLTDADAAQLTGSMNLLGTPAYMSPEQARSTKHIDARSDQYTLAVILYQCVTGRVPFASEGIYDLIRKVVEGIFPPPSELVPGLPPEFEAVILRGMANKPDDRYRTTWEFGAALLPFASLRTQVLWETEFSGKSSTVAHASAPPRTGSSASVPALHTPALDPSLARPLPAASDAAPPAGEVATRLTPKDPSLGGASPSAPKRTASGQGPALSKAAQGESREIPTSPDQRPYQSSLEVPLSSQATRLSPSVDSLRPPAPQLEPETEAEPELELPSSGRRTGVIAIGLGIVVLGGLGAWWLVSGPSGAPTPSSTSPTMVVHASAPATPPVEPTPTALTPAPTAVAPAAVPVPAPVAVEAKPVEPSPAPAPAPKPPPAAEPAAALVAAEAPAVPKAKKASSRSASADGQGTLHVAGKSIKVEARTGQLALGTFGEFQVDLDYTSEGGHLNAHLRSTPAAQVSVNEGPRESTKNGPVALPPLGRGPARIVLQHGDGAPAKLVLTFEPHSP